MPHELVGFQWKMLKHRNYWEEKEMNDLKGFLADCIVFSVGLAVGSTIMIAILFIPAYLFIWLIS